MTNEQLYLAIGIPILFNAGMVAILMFVISMNKTNINARMTSMESRMTSIESRMLALEKRMTDFEASMGARFDLIMGRLVELEKEILKR